MNATNPNVFITTSKEVIQDFLQLTDNKISSKKFLSTLSEEQKRRSIIAGPEYNSNLIELEHTFLIGGEGHYLRLRLLETNGSFEEQFISTYVYPEIAGNILNQKRLLGKNFVDLETDLQASLLEPARRIYFCYGIGENANNWAGPFVMDFMKGNFTISENGIKELSLEFRGETGKLLRNEIEGTSSDLAYTTINKYENIYSNKRILYKKENDLLITNRETKFDFLTEDEESQSTNSITKIAKQLIYGYFFGIINDITTARPADQINRNIIVLLPNLNRLTGIMLENYIDQKTTVSLKEQLAFFNKESVIEDLFLGSIEERVGLGETVKATLKSGQVIDISKTNLISRGETFRESKFRLPNAVEILDALMPDPLVRELGFGCEIVPDKVQIQKATLNNSTPGNIDVANEAAQETPSKSFIIRTSLSLGEDSKETDLEMTPDYYLPIQKLNNNLKSLYQSFMGYAYKPVLLVETDMRILKIWKKYGFIADENSQAYIFGDEELINDILYLTNCYTILEANQVKFPINNISKSDYKKFVTDARSYRLEYYKTIKKRKNNSAFGENVLSNDELALSELQAASLKALDIPVFRYNISNPNVLSVSLDNNYTYLSVLDVAYENKLASELLKSGTVDVANMDDKKVVYENKQVSGGVQVTLSDLVEAYKKQYDSANFTAKNTKEKLDEIDSFLNNFYQKNGYDLTESNEQKNIKFEQLAFVLLRKLEGANAFAPVISVSDEQSKFIQQKDIYDELQKLIVQLNIKTLPFFQISGNTNNLLSYFVGLQNMIGRGSGFKTKSIFDGRYFIMAWKHLISTREAYSEFQLKRDLNQ
ncbi:MAG: hypothetical protein RL348_835 [Bacteroidota bacterium]